jgi:hypothetical protein
MGKSSKNEKRSFLKISLSGFAARLRKGPQKSNEAMSPIVEAGRSVIQSIAGAQSAYQEQESKKSEGLDKDRYAPVPEEHVKPEKRKKAIGHIEKLLKQISQLQNEIENGLKTEIHLEQEISNLVVASERSPHQIPQRKKVKEHRKKEAEELSVTKKPVRKRRKRSQKNAKKDSSPQANNNKVRKKLCPRCKKRKGESNFHKDRSCKDGLARWCKECKAKNARTYRKKQTVK